MGRSGRSISAGRRARYVALGVSVLAVLLAGLCLGDLSPAAPSCAEAVQRALLALGGSDPAGAERIALELISQGGPDAWRAWVIVAVARERAGQYTRAEQAYRRFLSGCQSPAERAYAMERIQRCLSASSPSAGPAPLSRSLSPGQLARFSAVGQEHVESSEHFVIRARNAELAKFIVGHAEAVLARICQFILPDQEYPHSVDIHVWPDLEAYQQHAVSAREWAGGSFSLRADPQTGLITRRIDLTQRDENGRFSPAVLDRVLPHELCHLVLAEFFGDAHCPIVVNEGLAMLAETAPDNGRVMLAGAAIAGGNKIPLARLLTVNDCQEVDPAIFYAQAYSLACYLRGRLSGQQFRELLEFIKAGCTLEEALQRAVCAPPQEDFLNRLAQAWEAEAVRQFQFLHVLEVHCADAS